MTKNRTIIFAFTLLAALFTMQAIASERLIIYTVNYPLQYFAQRIAGEHANVVFPTPSDVDPAFWTPDAEIVGDYQRADLILLNGANYAKWINKVSLPRARLVNTSKDFSDNYIRIESNTTHSHGTGADHSHAGIAFTTWLDMQQAVLQARAIKQAIINKLPQLSEKIEKNFENLANDLMTLDAEMKSIVSDYPGAAILASHPVYQYMARRYEISLHSVMWEPDVFPDKPQWKQLERLANKYSSNLMIWEALPLPLSTETLEHMNIVSVVFDPCSNQPDQGDFLSVMKENIKRLGKLLQG